MCQLTDAKGPAVVHLDALRSIMDSGGSPGVLESLRNTRHRAVGTKQTLKAIRSGEAKVVYLALDADEHVLAPLRAALATSSIPTCEVDSMKQLGRVCGIEVGAAAAALL